LVRRITITLDDEEFKKWKNVKGKKSWHEFFRELIKVKEEIEGVPLELLRGYLRRTCNDLADLASTCSPLCGREETLLRLCSGDADLELLLRALVIVTNSLEEQLEEHKSWIVRLLKATIIEVCRGDVRAAKKLLEEVCSSR